MAYIYFVASIDLGPVGMPATATLLKKLKEILGEDATSDLESWVDHSTARDIAQLRDLADLHYQRFDARLEQRLAELKAELRLDHRLAELKSELRLEVAGVRADLIKWMFIFWAGTIVPLGGLIVVLFRL